ncbi:chorismate mutase [Candidatus Bathyarchaeota archaeon]|nr:chorismate mutase [Candidatus Bathyarchaeota archaeon]MBL7078928.1 chorismate mutase [Candidatus Bathyarchaeota archaeon]
MTYEEEIGPLRDEINRLNVEIVERLADRVRVAMEIGAMKHRHSRPIVDRSREARVYQQVRALAEEAGIDPGSVEKVFREIIALCTQAELEDQA